MVSLKNLHNTVFFLKFGAMFGLPNANDMGDKLDSLSTVIDEVSAQFTDPVSAESEGAKKKKQETNYTFLFFIFF